MKWILLLLLLQGCAALNIQKECKPVYDSELDLSVCRQVLPWE